MLGHTFSLLKDGNSKSAAKPDDYSGYIIIINSILNECITVYSQSPRDETFRGVVG